MKILVLVFIATVSCLAQTQGNLPGPLDANTGFNSNAGCSSTSNCINFPEPVQVGNEVVGCVLWGSAGTGPTGITDSLGNTATLEPSYTFGSSGNDRPFTVQMYHYNSAFSGAGYVIITGGSDMYSKTYSRWTGVSDSKDGSLTNNNATPSAPLGSVTNSVTSTINGDIAISCLANTQGGSSTLNPGDTGGMITSDNASGATTQVNYQNLGLLGGYSIKANLTNSNGSDTVAISTALFKPTTTIFLSDTVMPQAADGVAYKAQLHVVGGISTTLTYACTGLPSNGLSLNTSTGVISGASPTGTGILSLGCTVSDGTNTSATDSLPLTVGVGFGTISTGSFVSGTFPNGGNSLPGLAVGCSDLVMLCMTQGDDTHGGSGWLQALNGANNYYRDSLNSTSQRFPLYGGTSNGPTSCIVYGPVSTGGIDVISGFNNQSASSALTAWALDIKNAQGILDVGTFTNAITNLNNPSVSTSYTTPVPNEFAVSPATIACETAACSFLGTDSVSFGAPFSVSYQTGGQIYAMSGFGTATIAAAGSVTSTATFNGVTPTNGNHDSVMLVALRPALAGTCTGSSSGEKQRRYIN